VHGDLLRIVGALKSGRHHDLWPRCHKTRHGPSLSLSIDLAGDRGGGRYLVAAMCGNPAAAVSYQAVPTMPSRSSNWAPPFSPRVAFSSSVSGRGIA
jgi:hypothetical protein